MMMARFLCLCLTVLLLPLGAHAYGVGTPIATDSRIKTFVYNENDVYRLLTHYGYQLNIEFGNKEEIETISVGDRTGWQIIPAGQRLFVRGMEDKAHTNMTVVTNRHAYQFDLYSSPPGEQGWDELVYVVRFYYPEDQDIQTAAMGGGFGGGMAMGAPPYGGYVAPPSPMYYPPVQPPYNPAAYGAVPYGSSPVSMMTSPPMMDPYGGGDIPSQAALQPAPMLQSQPSQGYGMAPPAPPPAAPNYNYSFTGEQSILPTQMYDDGQRTTLVFAANQMTPQISVVTPAGKEQVAAMNVTGQTVTLEGIFARMVLRVGGSHACIYNENLAK